MSRRVIITLAAALVSAVTWSATAAAQPEPAAAGCAELGGTAVPDQICRVVTESTTYSIDMSYPLDYPDQRALTDYLKRDRDEFVDYVATIPCATRHTNTG